ncbi:VCBS repeat-containing protein [Mucilaginibacter sp. dw_454]|uniref:FG-GAP repeat domain-containing protein n=1 Tax=Mucilaginibacter sp. dw_454 TaxID=2720079 RepID=UPI001BD5E3CD|nr:VCBS repeat-containing protein [Mucilaginibacter sp. dw_454]
MRNQFYLILIAVLLSPPLYAQNKVRFIKHIITKDFISEGVAVGDVNHDGKLDIIAGTCWFEAPNWTRHEIALTPVLKPGTEYSNSFLDYSIDVNLDGWVDQVVVGYPGTPAYWYENPKGKSGYWQKHNIMDKVGVGNESPNFVDVDGDGRVDILCADINAKQIVWLSAPTKKGDTTWARYPISAINAPATDRYSHGLGLGDINKDGRKDVIVKEGWWEAPVDRKQPNWVFHPANFGEDCSEMYVMDVDGDGLNDVISASAHKYGIWWYQQGKDEQGNTTWTKHEIDKSFSETHGVALVDINNDGHPDIVTGKRWFAHNDTDTGSHESAVLYWFEFTPGKAPYFIAHQIDNDSGVGLHVVVQDMNKDKLNDIVISNKKGVFYFENTR